MDKKHAGPPQVFIGPLGGELRAAEFCELGSKLPIPAYHVAGEAHVFRLAALQMISGPELAPNLATAARLIAEAAGQGAQLVALPEYFPIIEASRETRLAVREAPDVGPIQDFLAELAQRHGIWIVGGSIPLLADDPLKFRNSSLVFDPAGRQVARYDKIHLFGFRKGEESYDEAATIEAGAPTPVAFDVPHGGGQLHVGLSICYDLRFPELFRQMGALDLIVLPAAFTDTTGRAHWEVLLRSRAIENQCYVLAVAQGGRHPGGRLTHGNSMIIDPWGEVLARIDKGEGVIVAELDPARIAEVRESLPALKHRRL
ncbi:MAG: carbon-nitrogen hydrolase family protein [Gammaproteobacteria bacterium]|nr:carbon-nitrogen hydrolase family protein [Rhodocyclaceae bacterium]MBU3910311.1 carbon-nitrogen hydrolase family protein [Gammaproteobacteria bacterium]MBU3990241.1 carbon-nitrogen hydrolase family protein [Gammaproteobacteria bacterium]MBU4004138.1 carbon-nitrogen hydrolase family protein [Gammaproteobacteria bacterium]MBU4020385.1 carbon-nitrogen hydrolase family protein [Gammaproteobacteria bacterium]